jgi:hypothetical protein
MEATNWSSSAGVSPGFVFCDARVAVLPIGNSPATADTGTNASSVFILFHYRQKAGIARHFKVLD